MTRTGRSALGAVLVFAAALLAFVPGIGTRVIWTRDEARTALVIREMLETGEWSLARMPGGVPSKKPPLYHWLAALIARHGLDETTLRLPAAVAGAGAAALTYLLGAQLATPGVGLMAAAVLIGSPAFFEWARIGRMETLLAFCFTLSLWGIARWLRWGGLVNGLVFGVGLGLAILTKGPVGLLPLAVAGLGLLMCRSRPGHVRELAPGLAFAVAVPIAWLGVAALTAIDFAEHAGSVAPTLASELARPASRIRNGLMALVIGFLPWTLLLPGCAVLLARRRPAASSVVVVALWWLAVVLSISRVR